MPLAASRRKWTSADPWQPIGEARLKRWRNLARATGETGRVGAPERSLVPTFTVGENVLLDRIIGDGHHLINRRQVHADALPFARRIGRKVLFSEAELDKWQKTRRSS